MTEQAADDDTASRSAAWPTEQVLAGGNMNDVVRVGDTVRRVTGAWTSTVHRLLEHLRVGGVTEVPEPLGFDAQGRETLSFVPGTVANYPTPSWVWSESILIDSARLLRRMHDASAAFEPGPDPVWQLAAHEPAEVICHNDFAPYNLVFDDGRLVGVIDFDTASPGPRIWDLAYLAYRLVPFVDEPDDHPPAESELYQRLDLLIESYGRPFTRAEVLRTMIERLCELADFTDDRAAETGRTDLIRHAALYRRDAGRIAVELRGC